MSGAAIGAAVISAIGGYAASQGAAAGGDFAKKRDSPYTESQLELINKMVGEVKPQVGEGVEAWPGSIVQDPTQTQEAAAEAAPTMLSQVLDTAKRGEEFIEESREEWDPAKAEQRWHETVQAPAIRGWQEKAAPQIMEEYAGRSALSSSAVGESLAESREDLSKHMGTQLADLTFRDYKQHKQGQLARAQQGQSMLGQALNQAMGVTEMSNITRDIEQRQLQEQKQKWQYEQPYNNPWLGGSTGGMAMQSPGYQTSYISQPPSAGAQMATSLGGTMQRVGGSVLGRQLGQMGGRGGGGVQYGGQSYGSGQQPYGSWSRSAY